MEEIIVEVPMYEIDIAETYEFGKKFTWRCPRCSKELRYFDGASFANDLKCECGLVWSVELRAFAHESNDGCS